VRGECGGGHAASGEVHKDGHDGADDDDAAPRHCACDGYPDGGAGEGTSLGVAPLAGAVLGQHCKDERGDANGEDAEPGRKARDR